MLPQKAEHTKLIADRIIIPTDLGELATLVYDHYWYLFIAVAALVYLKWYDTAADINGRGNWAEDFAKGTAAFIANTITASWRSVLWVGGISGALIWALSGLGAIPQGLATLDPLVIALTTLLMGSGAQYLEVWDFTLGSIMVWALLAAAFALGGRMAVATANRVDDD